MPKFVRILPEHLGRFRPGETLEVLGETSDHYRLRPSFGNQCSTYCFPKKRFEVLSRTRASPMRERHDFNHFPDLEGWTVTKGGAE